jgi:sensor histidine kinase YesM
MNVRITTDSLSDFFLQFFTNQKYRVIRHSLLILLLIASTWKNTLPEPINAIIHLFLALVILSLFYFNMYYLVPRYLFKDKFLHYCAYIALIIGIVVLSLTVFKYVFAPNFKEPHKSKFEELNLFSAVFILIILIASSSTIKLFQRLIVDSNRISELESITAKVELEQLKNQINPHFLFNMLNNANVLTKRDPEKASQVLMKLGDLLRYQLYDSTRNFVLLTGDIHFLEDFLNLEKIRRDNFESIVSKTGDLSGVQIAPLLFVIFVENAIKHNMDAEKESFVHLFFKVHDDELHFKCVNSKPALTISNQKQGGLGLVNIKRRLQLLYPENHKLHIMEDADSFTVYLTITLDSTDYH